jgi:hypothetical protein
MPNCFNARIVVAAALLCAAASAAFGHVLRVEVSSCEDVLGGAVFGSSGAYERITGRVIFSVTVANPHNRQIVDLDHAVNLKGGAVEFSADVIILRPKNPARGNGTLLLEVPNRGRARIVRMLDGGDWNVGSNAGDGWLLRQGYSYASLGWQSDATGEDPQRLYAPIARDHGRTITGLLRGDIMPAQDLPDIPLGHMIVGTLGGTEYPVAAPDDPRNSLSERAAPAAERHLIPRDQWSFAHLVDGRLEPSVRHIHLNGGFKAGQIYEYIYAVADPVVAGLGFAAVRDFASYVKHSPGAIVPAQRVIGEGISQNGRFLRHALPGLQCGRTGPHRTRRRAGTRRGCRPRQLQCPLRATLARSRADLVDFGPGRSVSVYRSAGDRSGHEAARWVAAARHCGRRGSQDFPIQYQLRILGTRGLADHDQP